MRFRRSSGYTIRTSQSGDCYINGQSIPDNHQVVLHDGEPVRIYAHLKPDTIISFKFRRDGQEWRRVYHVTDQKVFVGRARSKQHQGAV